MSLWMDWGLVFRSVRRSVDVVASIFASTSSYWVTAASFRIRFWRSCCTFFRYTCHNIKQSEITSKMWEDSIKACMTPQQMHADSCVCCQPNLSSIMWICNISILSDQKEYSWGFKQWLSHRVSIEPVSSKKRCIQSASWKVPTTTGGNTRNENTPSSA